MAGKLHLKVVESKKQKADFHKVPFLVYKNDQEWIPHLKQDVERIFVPNKNLQFTKGNAIRWVLYKGAIPVGRVAAFVWNDRSYGGLGFFESTENEKHAKMLLEVAEKWMLSQGKSRLQAPINFGERDKFWGLLVEGFQRPSFQENYNPPYYKSFFTNNGYEKVIEQNTSEMHIVDFDGEKFGQVAKKANQIDGLEIRPFQKSQLKKYVKDFYKIYNEAWKEHEHFVPLSEKRIASLFKSMKAILKEEILLFAYVSDVPVGFYLSVIDVNQIFKKLKGNLNLFGKIKFLWFRRSTKIDRIRGIIFGVVPGFQGKGVAYAMIFRLYESLVKDPHIKSSELAWVGDFNPRMLKLFEKLGVKKTKTHFTFEKLLSKD